MRTLLTIKLGHPVRSVHRVPPGQTDSAAEPRRGTEPQVIADPVTLDLQKRLADVEQQQGQLAQTCQLLDDLACRLSRLHEEMVAPHRKEIARLAVEIARKVLGQKVQQGDYDVEAIIQEALEQAPAKQGVTIHVSSQDWQTCQRLQQQRPDSPWACLTFVADPGMGPAQCLVETPKGVVKSFIEEHLDKIQKALEKAGQASG